MRRGRESDEVSRGVGRARVPMLDLHVLRQPAEACALKEWSEQTPSTTNTSNTT